MKNARIGLVLAILCGCGDSGGDTTDATASGTGSTTTARVTISTGR